MADNYDSLKNELEILQTNSPDIAKKGQDLNHKLLELYSLYQIGLALSTTLDLDEIFNMYIKIFQDTLSVDRFGIFLINRSDSTLTLHTSFGMPKKRSGMKTE